MGMSMIKNYKLGYRVSFIVGIAMNLFAMACIFFFYHPVRNSLMFTLLFLIVFRKENLYHMDEPNYKSSRG